MSGEDLTASRVRRMLPSVSEVLKALTARAPIEPEIAFRAAREVCAEELKRIRDAGGESIPLEDLVQRAFLRATGADLNIPAVAASPPPPFVNPPPPIPASAADAPVQGGPQDVEDPFSETTGAMDLRWDRDAREPFTEPAVPVASLASGLPKAFEPTEEIPPISFPAETEPYREERPEIPVRFGLPSEDAPDVAGREPVPASMAEAVMEPEPAMPAFSAMESVADEGPGNETLARLSREAEAFDLNAVFPKGAAPGTVPFALPPTDPEESRAESPEPTPFEDDEDTVLTIPRTGRSGRREDEGGPRFGLVLGIIAGLVALAGLGYLLVGLWVERDATPPPVAVARPKATSSPIPGPAGPVAGAAGGSEAPASSSIVEGATPSAPETAVPSVPANPGGTGAAAAGAVLAAPSPSPVSTVVPTAVPSPVARVVPTPVQGVAPAPAPVSIAPVPPAPAAVTARQSRDGLVVTKDRAGQPQVFSIHFTSYKDRASAERDLKRIQGLVGREGYVAEVDLGAKGVWQRVMIGTFSTAEDAKAVREELLAKGTRDMGWVYRVVGPEGPDRR